MTIPRVTSRKSDGNTGVVLPSATGIAAIIAAASAGPTNKVSSFSRDQFLLDAHGYSPLASDGAYIMSAAQKPILAVRPETATAAAYGSITVTGAPEDGAAFVAGSSAPLEDYIVRIDFLTEGTVGTPGVTYTTSLDDGVTTSAVKALGSSTTISIPDSGVSINLIDGGEGDLKIAAGETVAFRTTAPRMNGTNLAASLTALYNTQRRFECVLVDSIDATTAIVGQLDAWLKTLNARGIYPTALVNVRRKGASETEQAYFDAIAPVVSAAASTDVLVCVDGGDVTDSFTGLTMVRPTALGVTGVGMAIPIGEDPAFVARGPVPNFQIVDANSEPKHHNEELFPGFDAIRLTTMRTFAGRTGAYVTNAKLVSPPGSDWVYWQHARTMNEQCRIAHELLTNQLSRGVQKDPEPGPNGERYILAEEAEFIEGLVNTAIERELVKPKHVSEAQFALSRDDDLSSNEGAKLTGWNEQVAKSFVKEFDITNRFVRSITARARV